MKDSILYRLVQAESRSPMEARFGRELDFPTRGTLLEVEEGDRLMPKFDAEGLIPCIAQEASTGDVLMLGYMNRTALSLTIRSGYVHYWSRSRKRIWHKGEKSGQSQLVEGILIDDDQDCVLIRVRLVRGAACHVGYHSCFFRRLSTTDPRSGFRLDTIEPRKVYDPKVAYGQTDESP